ncbi:diguanylate cyclase domain-containing protein [Mesorhizobium sp. ASY16-5R]|uniref:diguanylate cyclase domain-containing protein n=1 Tax=Mesorhizobium sp. ASY16-5R TaxID=3445772 RepID=UPI003FA0EB25
MSATDLHRQSHSNGDDPGMWPAKVWRRVLTAGLWLLAVIGLFAIVATIDLYDRLFAATRLYEDWELDELLSLLLCAGLVSIVFLAIRTRQLFREIARREAAERLAHESARHDPLTGLANRRRFGEALRTAIAISENSSSNCAVLFIDLDGFKPVNDTYGHAVGDEVLIAVAEQIAHAAPEGTTVARLGGDEFGIVIPGSTGRESLLFLAQRLARDMARPRQFGTSSLAVGATVGIAVHPDDGRDAEALIASADQAMYAAKRAKRVGTPGRGDGRIKAAS